MLQILQYWLVQPMAKLFRHLVHTCNSGSLIGLLDGLCKTISLQFHRELAFWNVLPHYHQEKFRILKNKRCQINTWEKSRWIRNCRETDGVSICEYVIFDYKKWVLSKPYTLILIWSITEVCYLPNTIKENGKCRSTEFWLRWYNISEWSFGCSCVKWVTCLKKWLNILKR